MTLDTLLIRSNISRYYAQQWFSHCRFDGHTLLCTDKDEAGYIQRCYLPNLQEHVPGLVVVFTKAAPPKLTKPQRAAFKLSYYEKMPDLLD